MQDISGKITYKVKYYKLVFNLNVMQQIQTKYGSLEKWGGLTDGSQGEPNAEAVIYGFNAMINEGIDIANEERGTNEPFMTLRQTGRLISEVGLQDATMALNQTVIDSTESGETAKNG